MKWCQLVVIAICVINFFGLLYTDFHGRKTKEPGGFAGAISTVIVSLAMAALFWGAGAFSEWF